MKLLLSLVLFAAAALSAQTNPACPNATGPAPHCVVINWSAPTSGTVPTGYNVYTGGTTKGQCSSVTASSCTKIGSVTASVLTFTQNSSTTTMLTEGATYYYVLTSTNGTSESVPSVEVSAVIPFLVPGSPAVPSAVAH
jgi:hypothetical protein